MRLYHYGAILNSIFTFKFWSDEQVKEHIGFEDLSLVVIKLPPSEIHRRVVHLQTIVSEKRIIS
jgi:hypothetical protein